LLQLVRRKEPLSIFQEAPKPQPATEGKSNSKALSTALITVLSINVFVIAGVASFYLLLSFYQK
jgi:hypothetical protein